MSNALHKPERCELCGKKKDHDLHQAPKRPPLWKRLLWPTHIHQKGGTHRFVDRDRRVRAAEGMARLRRRNA